MPPDPSVHASSPEMPSADVGALAGQDLRGPDGYADLGSYAAVGDVCTIALIARDGRIDWLPLPDMDSPPAFAAVLDADHGGFIALRPTADFTVQRHYVPETNVLATTFTTASGRVGVMDSLNTGVAGRLPWAELGRRIDGLEGHVELEGVVAPGTRLNTASPWVQETSVGVVLRLGELTMAVRTLHDDDVTITDDVIHALMDRLVPATNGGLLAEMIDPATGAHPGNLPQALSLLALTNAAITATDG